MKKRDLPKQSKLQLLEAKLDRCARAGDRLKFCALIRQIEEIRYKTFRFTVARDCAAVNFGNTNRREKYAVGKKAKAQRHAQGDPAW